MDDDWEVERGIDDEAADALRVGAVEAASRLIWLQAAELRATSRAPTPPITILMRASDASEVVGRALASGFDDDDPAVEELWKAQVEAQMTALNRQQYGTYRYPDEEGVIGGPGEPGGFDGEVGSV